MGRRGEGRKIHKDLLLEKKDLGLEMLSPEIVLHFNFFEFLVDRLGNCPASLKFLEFGFWETEAAILPTTSRRFNPCVPGFWGPKFLYVCFVSFLIAKSMNIW